MLASTEMSIAQLWPLVIALQTLSFPSPPLGPLQVHCIPSQLLYTPGGGYGKFWLILHVLEGTDTGDSRGHPRLALSSAVLTPF